MAKKTNGVLRTYKSYNFRDKDPVIDVLRTLIRISGVSFATIEAESGVSASTLYNWFFGKTRRPQFATVNAVARALNQDFKLTKR